MCGELRSTPGSKMCGRVITSRVLGTACLEGGKPVTRMAFVMTSFVRNVHSEKPRSVNQNEEGH